MHKNVWILRMKINKVMSIFMMVQKQIRLHFLVMNLINNLRSTRSEKKSFPFEEVVNNEQICVNSS